MCAEQRDSQTEGQTFSFFSREKVMVRVVMSETD
jgi:hypothetical protein